MGVGVRRPPPPPSWPRDPASDAHLRRARSSSSSFERRAALIERQRLHARGVLSAHTAYGMRNSGGLFALPLPGVEAIAAARSSQRQPTRQTYLASRAQPGWQTPSAHARPVMSSESCALGPGQRLGTLRPSQPGAASPRHLLHRKTLLRALLRQLAWVISSRWLPRACCWKACSPWWPHARRTPLSFDGRRGWWCPWLKPAPAAVLRSSRRMVPSVEGRGPSSGHPTISPCDSKPPPPVVALRDSAPRAGLQPSCHPGQPNAPRIAPPTFKGLLQAYFFRPPRTALSLSARQTGQKAKHRLCRQLPVPVHRAQGHPHG